LISRILGRANAATTLDIYADLFDDARHAADIRTRMSRSEFARLLEDEDEGDLITLPAAAGPEGRPSARERAAIPWTT
jgi:hypothetical protein